MPTPRWVGSGGVPVGHGEVATVGQRGDGCLMCEVLFNDPPPQRFGSDVHRLIQWRIAFRKKVRSNPVSVYD